MQEMLGCNNRNGSEVAVIGMAGRFPGAANIEEFWENVVQGVESLTFISMDEMENLNIDPAWLDNPNYVNSKGGQLEGKELFDASFFGYTPAEADVMDPQMRLFHECVWECLENAGYNPDTYDRPIGLFAGASHHFTWEAGSFIAGKISGIGYFDASNLVNKDYLCSRVSYALNLDGPAVTIYTACSTSLVAIHMANQAILNGECDIALAGGVTVYSQDGTGYVYQEGMISSPDGHCRAFDARAKGTVGGSGACVVALKLLTDAEADGDYIYAVVKGTAVNNDGNRKAGYSAPSREGQSEVIALAHKVAEVEPGTIAYVEAHGTGTAIGDPIELEALKQGFLTDKRGFCGLGSVKSNVGHLGAAAGAAGFIKTVMALKHLTIPLTLHFETPNPQFDFINSPFYISVKSTPWERGEYALRAGVNSFGIGGTNAHAVLEEAPTISCLGEAAPPYRDHLLLPLSARTRSALERLKQNLSGFLKRNPGIDLADVTYTLQVGRKAFKHRWLAVYSTPDEALESLTTPGMGQEHEVTPLEAAAPTEEIDPPCDKDSLIRIGQMWLQGQTVKWENMYPGQKPRRVPLPTYPFERGRFWIDEDVFAYGLDITKVPQAARAGQKTGMADWFYLPSWKHTVTCTQANGEGPSSWLVFINKTSLGKKLIKRLRDEHRDVVVVKAGREFRSEESGSYTIDPRKNEHYERLFDGLARAGNMPARIIHLWNLTGYSPGELTFPGFEKVQNLGFYSLLYITRALGRQAVDNKIRLAVVTDHLQQVDGSEDLSPEKAPLLGILKVIPQEYPDIRCSNIDILLPGEGSPAESFLVTGLCREFILDTPEPVVAFRKNRRWVQIYDPLHLEEIPEGVGALPRLRKHGIYLITGGMGNVGLMFARLLAERAEARLVLMGRSPFPPRGEWAHLLGDKDESDPLGRKIRQLQEVEEKGGKVLYLQADVAQLEQMKDVLRSAQETFGTINGVIHAAGIVEAKAMRTIRDLSEEDFRLQFRAKVQGTLVLRELFNDRELDFFWMLSSISCVLGGLGFAAYASANSFLDVLVREHNQGSVSPWFSLNWDGMDTDESIRAFERLFALEGIDQVVFSNGGRLQERIDAWIKLESTSKAPTSRRSKSSLRPRPDLSTPYEAPGNRVEETVTAIWRDLLGFDKIGALDDFLELGGDSLKAITSISRIHRDLHVLVEVDAFFSNPTARGIADYISTRGKKQSFVSIRTVEKKEYYPLTPMQRRMYIAQQMDLEGTSYNVPTAVILKGKLELPRLKRTCSWFIRRHESLRTRFFMLGQGPVQSVEDEVAFDLATFESSMEEAREIFKDFIKPFDLGRAPLLRVGLVQTAPKTWVLILDMHHLICDAVSHGVLVNDFAVLYEGGAGLSPLNIHYKDFAVWYAGLIASGEMKKSEDYWLDRFKDRVPDLGLVTDYPRPAVRKIDQGAHLGVLLEKKLVKDLSTLLEQGDFTLFILLLAAYYVLIFKYTKNEDIVVGTPIAGRNHSDLHNVVGVFLNMLALRCRPRGAVTFREFLAEVKECAHSAFENQNYQFDELVVKLGLQGDSSSNPLFDTEFAVIKPDTANMGMKDLQIEHFPGEVNFAKFDLHFQITDSPGHLHLTIRYSTQLFKPTTIEKIKNNYIEILEQVARDITVTLDNITLSHGFLVAAPRQEEEKGDFNL